MRWKKMITRMLRTTYYYNINIHFDIKRYQFSLNIQFYIHESTSHYQQPGTNWITLYVCMPISCIISYRLVFKKPLNLTFK